MKAKSKVASDIKSLVLARAKIYTKEKPDTDSHEEEIQKSTKPLRKATEADKARKREKMRLKRQMKREAKLRSRKKDPEIAQAAAINYLRLWNSSRESWSFKKKQQYWLLNNAFDTDCISDSDFEILLNYIMELKGLAKSRLIEKSEKIIELQEEKIQNSARNSSGSAFERARSILQILF
ncbi:uncharacterized protein NPIL_226011 [Nephila pilipes]|uniref:WKF domain-containing protein n=1 Tax=Nephila pilipes TaxID=299642 RepID=A0A8X6UHI7_NEPPI|nr:uncharacterized protein NPIL_226011 [Nephila pilipes]